MRAEFLMRVPHAHTIALYIGVIPFHVDEGAVMPAPVRLRVSPSLWLNVTVMPVYK